MIPSKIIDLINNEKANVNIYNNLLQLSNIILYKALSFLNVF